MDRRRVLQVGSVVWAVIGASVALSALGIVDADARLVVSLISVGGPFAAVGAARLLARGADRSAGALLLVSVLTPTYFAYVLNLPALIVGLALVIAPRAVLRGSDRMRANGRLASPPPAWGRPKALWATGTWLGPWRSPDHAVTCIDPPSEGL